MQTIPDENESTSTSSSSNNISSNTDIHTSSSCTATSLFVATKAESFYLEDDEDEIDDEDELFHNESSGAVPSMTKSSSMDGIIFETGATLAEELAFVFAQENNHQKQLIMNENQNPSYSNKTIDPSTTISTIELSKEAPFENIGTTNQTNNLDKKNFPNDKETNICLPHQYVNVSEYLGSVVQEMSVTPSPSPQTSPKKHFKSKTELREPPVPAAISNLTVFLDHKPNSSSSSNSNSNSNSSTSSVIATPISKNPENSFSQSIGNTNNDSSKLKDMDLVDSYSSKKPNSKSIDLKLDLKPSHVITNQFNAILSDEALKLQKSSSMIAFDEKFSNVSLNVQNLTASSSSSSASSSSSSTSDSSSTSLNQALAPLLGGLAPTDSSSSSAISTSLSNTSNITSTTNIGAKTKQLKTSNVTTTMSTTSLETDLLHWNDMPNYLQFNPYVLEGYRPLQTFKGCLLSLFWWHNETINILTHGLPIVYILAIVPGLMPWDNGYRFLSFCHVFGSVAPWCGSFIYHLFMNLEKGENIYYRLLKLDMVGIWVSQSFGALPLVTATTFCFSFKWKWLIIVSYCLMSLWGLYKALTASSPWQRRLCFALPFGMRTFLTLLRTMGLVGGNPVALPHVYLQDGVSVLGGAIGAIRIPEKWFPGLVDYYLNSHNIMHVLVVLAVYSMHKATIKDFEWMSATNCDALTNTTTSEALNLSFSNHMDL